MDKNSKKSHRLLTTAADDVQHAKNKETSQQLMASSAYSLAYDDQAFLLRDEMRSVRLMLELEKTELILNEHNIDHTVVMFGSARIQSPEFARQRLVDLQQQWQQHPGQSELKKQITQAKLAVKRSVYYEQCQELAQLITVHSLPADTLNLYVITGGGPGIMEAANRGAMQAGGKSVGLNIVLPREQHPNPYITPELCFQFHYFAMRKMHFLLRAQALVVFPGGFGTLDEMFETLTLVQTEKIRPLPILLFGKSYWQKLINFEMLVEEGMIDSDDLASFQFIDTAAEAWDIIHQHIYGDNCQ